jgi:polar amino acid transport system permease protein
MSWTQYLPSLLQGAKITAEITFASIAVGGVLAFAAGIARVWGGPVLSAVALVYTEVFRGTSLLVQLFWLYYALPLVGFSFSPVATGIVGVGLHVGAYGAEIVRGGLRSVTAGQLEAARALNFGRFHTMWHIAMPQAIIEMMPGFGNLSIETLKLTALVSLISISDLTFRAQSLRNITQDTTTIYTLTLVGYFIMALALMGVMRFIEHKLRRGAAFPKDVPA